MLRELIKPVLSGVQAAVSGEEDSIAPSRSAKSERVMVK